jgi:hypothetical protein
MALSNLEYSVYSQTNTTCFEQHLPLTGFIILTTCLCLFSWTPLRRFAGAGLFDSIPSAPTAAHLINYTKEPMAFQKSAAAALLWQCALAAVAAEEVLQQQEAAAGSNGAGSSARVGLDVEGCITVDGSMWVVQARPQV